MQTTDVASWDEFVAEIERLKERYGTNRILGVDTKNIILYRGQARVSRRLQTTLERHSSRDWTDLQYIERAVDLAPEFESLTGKHWNLPTRECLRKQVAAGRWLSYEIPCYEYLAYLRQYGFPSPLLDWTASPYVAAFFAMAEQQCDEEKAAVFVYVEVPTPGKGGIQGSKNICPQGPYVDACERHFLQKSWYTICIQKVDGQFKFACHEDVFERKRSDQDLLYKITLPRAERLDLLRHLKKKRISEPELFKMENAAMQPLPFQDIRVDVL